MLSDRGVTIKSMRPTRGSTAAPQAPPLSALTREELGRVWARELRAARLAGQLRSVRGAAAWLADPAVREVLDEFRRRFLEREVERDEWMCRSVFDVALD